MVNKYAVGTNYIMQYNVHIKAILAVFLMRSTGVTVLNCMQNCVMHITNLIEACT